MGIRKAIAQKSFRDPAEEAVVSLLFAGARLMQQFEDVCRAHGITHDQYNVLRILRGVYPEGHPRFEIADRLISRAPDVTRLIDRLERQGYAERTWDPQNRRHSIARITRGGLDLLARVDPDLVEVQRRVTRSMSQRDLREICRLCDELVLESGA